MAQTTTRAFSASFAKKGVDLRSRYRNASRRQANPRTAGLLSAAPTITTATAKDAANTVNFEYNLYPDYFNFLGGSVFLNPANSFAQAYNATDPRSTYLVSAPPNGLGIGKAQAAYRVKIIVDSVKFSIRVLTNASQGYRLLVDGQYVSLTQTLATGSNNYIIFDFSAAGGRAVREIMLETASAVGVRSIHVSPTENLVKPRAAGFRLGVFGDSFTDGIGATFKGDGFAPYLGDLLGVDDLWASGVTGTGWLSKSATNNAYNLRERITDITSVDFDAIVIAMGVNDRIDGYSAAAIQAEVQAFFAALRVSKPTLPVFVLGVFPGASGPSNAARTVEDGISAAMSVLSDRFAAFIPCSRETIPFMSGTGFVGATNGSGNSDLYIAADGVHPNEGGHALTARWAAQKIMDASALIMP